MKRICYFLGVIILFGCDKNELPDITQQGEDTFGMLINGIPWRPYHPGIFTPGDRKPDIYFYENYELLYFDIKNMETDEYLYFSVDTVIDTGTYQINLNLLQSIGHADVWYCQDSTRFEIDFDCVSAFKLFDAEQSFISITRFDTSERIVSGLFEMTLVNHKDSILNITNGRFDSHFNILKN